MKLSDQYRGHARLMNDLATLHAKEGNQRAVACYERLSELYKEAAAREDAASSALRRGLGEGSGS